MPSLEMIANGEVIVDSMGWTIRDHVDWRAIRACPRCGHEHFTIIEHYLISRDSFIIKCWKCGRFEVGPSQFNVSTSSCRNLLP